MLAATSHMINEYGTAVCTFHADVIFSLKLQSLLADSSL